MFQFRGWLDRRTEWEKHRLAHESNAQRAVRLLKQLEKAIDSGIAPTLPVGEERGRFMLNIDINLDDFIDRWKETWGLEQGTAAFRKLLLWASLLPPKKEISPAEAIAKFKVGETIAIADWINLFHSPTAARHAAGQLKRSCEVDLRFGDTSGEVNKDYFFLPRGYPSGVNPVVEIVRMPPALKIASTRHRKTIAYSANGTPLLAFSVSETVQIMFGQSQHRGQLRTVLSQGGVLILENEERPFCVMTGKDTFLQLPTASQPVAWEETASIDLTYASLTDAKPLFYQHIIDSLSPSSSTPAIVLTLPEVGEVVLIQLGLFPFEAIPITGN